MLKPWMKFRLMDEAGEGGDPGSGGGGEGSGPDTSAVEAEARTFGWRPQEEFNGPAEKWRSAEEFLEEGKRINGFLRKDLQKLQSQLTARDATIADLQRSITEFAEFHRMTEQRAYEKARKELQDARKEALRNNDGDTVVEIEERLEALKPPAAPKTPEAAPAPKADPVWDGWVAQNQWFTNDKKLNAVANSYSALVRQENPDLVGVNFLEEVKRRVVEDFPEKFQSRREAPPAVLRGGESRGGSGRKTFADLPAEAKQACDKFVKQGFVKDRETYVRDYFGE